MSEQESTHSSCKSSSDHTVEKLLAAYQVAHENAHHHDAIIWEAAAIIWSANALLMGFVLEALSSTRLLVQVLVAVSSLLGVAMTWFLRSSFPRMKQNQQISWDICQKIERKLEMEFKVHSSIDEDYQSKGQKTRMQDLFRKLTTVFIIVWFVFFLASIGPVLKRIYECF